MKTYIQTTIAMILPLISFGQDKGIDQIIDEKFGNATGWFVDFIFYKIPFSENIQIFWVLFPLILGATYFTIYFKFINFTGFLTSINIVRGKYDDIESGGADHVEASHIVHTVDGDVVDTIRVEQDADHHG